MSTNRVTKKEHNKIRARSNKNTAAAYKKRMFRGAREEKRRGGRTLRLALYLIFSGKGILGFTRMDSVSQKIARCCRVPYGWIPTKLGSHLAKGSSILNFGNSKSSYHYPCMHDPLCTFMRVVSDKNKSRIHVCENINVDL